MISHQTWAGIQKKKHEIALKQKKKKEERNATEFFNTLKLGQSAFFECTQTSLVADVITKQCFLNLSKDCFVSTRSCYVYKKITRKADGYYIDFDNDDIPFRFKEWNFNPQYLTCGFFTWITSWLFGKIDPTPVWIEQKGIPPTLRIPETLLRRSLHVSIYDLVNQQKEIKSELLFLQTYSFPSELIDICGAYYSIHTIFVPPQAIIRASRNGKCYIDQCSGTFSQEKNFIQIQFTATQILVFCSQKAVLSILEFSYYVSPRWTPVSFFRIWDNNEYVSIGN